MPKAAITASSTLPSASTSSAIPRSRDLAPAASATERSKYDVPLADGAFRAGALVRRQPRHEK